MRIGVYFRLYDHNIVAAEMVEFVQQLHRQLGRRLILVWDRWSVHKTMTKKRIRTKEDMDTAELILTAREMLQEAFDRIALAAEKLHAAQEKLDRAERKASKSRDGQADGRSLRSAGILRLAQMPSEESNPDYDPERITAAQTRSPSQATATCRRAKCSCGQFVGSFKCKGSSIVLQCSSHAAD